MIANQLVHDKIGIELSSWMLEEMTSDVTTQTYLEKIDLLRWFGHQPLDSKQSV